MIDKFEENETGLTRMERIFNLARKNPKSNYCLTDSVAEEKEHIHILLDHRSSIHIDQHESV